MAVQAPQVAADREVVARRGRFRPGDLVTTADGYPVLYEVLEVGPDGLLRVRGANWAPGYSATVSATEVRPVTGILSPRA
jgi:hypothetical protein